MKKILVLGCSAKPHADWIRDTSFVVKDEAISLRRMGKTILTNQILVAQERARNFSIEHLHTYFDECLPGLCTLSDREILLREKKTLEKALRKHPNNTLARKRLADINKEIR